MISRSIVSQNRHFRVLLLALVGCLSIVIAGCGDETTPPTDNTDTGFFPDTGGNGDAAADADDIDTGDISVEVVETVVPSPLILAPTPGARVVSPIEVSGSGEANASIDVTLDGPGGELAAISGTAGDDGAFAVAVTFEAAARGDTLTLAVQQTTDTGTSAPTVVNLVQAAGPESPIVTLPTEGGAISNPLLITGTSEPGTTVHAELGVGAQVLGQTNVDVGGTGDFRMNLDYPDTDQGTELVLTLIAENEFGESEPVVTNVVVRSHIISGATLQEGVGDDGLDIHVALFASADEYLEPLYAVVHELQEGHTGVEFEFEVASGTYYLRAYRDVDATGPRHGYPQLWDPQSGPIEVVVDDADVSDLAPTLVDTGARLAPPIKEVDVMIWNEGWESGRSGSPCEGLSARAFVVVDPASEVAFSDPLVRTPRGADLVFGDSGDCHQAETVHFDTRADNDVHTAGFLAPTEADSGEYLMHYTIADGDFVHIYPDEVEFNRITRDVFLTSPAGSDPVFIPRPTFEWDSPGEGLWFEGHVRTEDDFFAVGPSQDTSFRLDNDLPDDTRVSVVIRTTDSDPSEGDVDAVSLSHTNMVWTDFDGDDTVFLTGDVENNTLENAPVRVVVRHSGDTILSTIGQPSSDGSYAVAVPRQEEAGSHVSAYLAVNDEAFSALSFLNVDLTGDAAIDLTFEPKVQLLSPADGQSGVGLQPVLVWADIADSMPEGDSYQYMVTLRKHDTTDTFSEGLWTVPSGILSFDFAHPPISVDSLAIETCLADGGELSGRMCNGPQRTGTLDLSASEGWTWSVDVLLGCEFADYLDNVDADESGVNDFIECRLDAGNATFAGSGPRLFWP